MKLTLRTLLAYVNHLLPPTDAKEFERLLNENDLAKNFCKRVESVMTRPELGAPEVLDRGPYLDPNITAEYLDNVLSDEESPEYEKLCLASDRQLAEVSACHQILTLVQAKPIDVENACREYIYTLPERVVQNGNVAPEQKSFVTSTSQSSKAEFPGPVPVPPSAPTVSSSTAPLNNPQSALENYAQMMTSDAKSEPEPRKNWFIWGLCGGAVLIVLAIFLLFMKPSEEKGTYVADSTSTQPTETKVQQTTSKSVKPSKTTSQKPVQDSSTTDSKSVLDAVEPPDSQPPVTKPDVSDKQVNPTISGKSPKDDSVKNDSITEESTVIPETSLNDEPSVSEQPELEKESVNSTPTKSADDKENKISETNAEAEQETSPVQTKTILGQFPLSKDKDVQVLLRKHLNQVGASAWMRILERSTIENGDTLIAFPDYCPTVVLGKNVHVRLVGPARVFLDPKSTLNEIYLKLEYGAIVVTTPKSFEGKVVVYSSNLPTVIEQTTSATKVAYQAMPTDLFDDDPAVNSVPFNGTAFILEGSVHIQDDSNNAIEAPACIDTQTGVVNQQGESPEWITNRVESSPELDKLFTNDTGNKHIGVLLSELVEQKGITGSVRRKALVSLAMIGKYTSLIEDFNKEERHAVWMDEFIVLQNAILISPLNAQMAKEELQKRYAEDGLTVYELLWKYQDKTISPEDAADILNCLQHDKLFVRVVAFCLLKNRGVQLGAYRPTDLKKSESTLKIMEEKFKKEGIK